MARQSGRTTSPQTRSHGAANDSAPPEATLAQQPPGAVLRNHLHKSETVPRFYLSLYVQDVSETIDFYALAFGLDLELAFSGHGEEFAKLDLHNGTMAVHWIQSGRLVEEPGSQNQPAVGFRLTVEVNELWAATYAASAAGAVLTDVYETRQRRAAIFRDRDGLLVEVYSTKPFDPNKELSEIERDLSSITPVGGLSGATETARRADVPS